MKSVIYKRSNNDKLRLRIFEPKNQEAKDMIPAIIFLQGSGGSQFFPQCKYFAMRGMVSFTAQFRVGIRHKTTQKYFEQLSDGKSAIRYIRSHATDFNIDPNKIVVVGASQGSIVALCSALIEGLEYESEDFSISSEPNALILLSPPIPYLKYITNFTHKRKSKEIIPVHEVKN
jgi:acetyl esterase/lipase